jgi:hypothetical protein
MPILKLKSDRIDAFHNDPVAAPMPGFYGFVCPAASWRAPLAKIA